MRTVDDVLMDLQQQSIERGFAGKLTDISVTLCEDGKTVSVWSHYYLDTPLMSSCDLPPGIDPAHFDFDAFRRRIEDASEPVLH